MRQNVSVKTQMEKPNVIEAQWHFAIPVYSKIIPDFFENQSTLIEHIDSIHLEQPGLRRSNLNAWHSEDDLHLDPVDVIQWVNHEIAVMARDCLQSCMPHGMEYDILMRSCWANVSGKGGWNVPHTHYPSQWSGVLYVAVNDVLNAKDSNDKSGKIDFFNPISFSTGFGLPSSITYTPSDGLMIIFPALLQHMVYPHQSDTERYSVAFNFDISPKRQ